MLPSPRIPATFALAFSTLLAAWAVPVEAAFRSWVAEGVRPCARPSEQLDIFACPDPQGGMFVTWADATGTATGVDVHAAKVNPDGYISLAWYCHAISDLPGSQGPWAIVADDSGGFYVLLEDDFGTNNWEEHMRVIRIDESGNPAAGWPEDGLLTSTLPTTQYYPQAISDGEGGLYVAWGDRRSDGDVYVQRYRPDGSLAPGWAPNGMPADTAQGFSGLIYTSGGLALAPDGSLLIAIGSRRPEPLTKLYIQKLLPTGQVAPGWPVNGLQVPTPNSGWGTIASDGLGGAFVGWTDLRTVPPGEEKYPYNWMEVYAHHVLADGTLDPSWPLTGLPICTAEYPQDEPKLLPDGDGGAFMVWTDSRDTGPGLYVMRLTPSGADPSYPVWGRRVCDLGFTYHGNAVLETDGAGGLYVAFDDVWNARTYLQHLTREGLPAPGWSSQGMPVTPDWTYQERPGIAKDGTGGVYVAWSDFYFGAGHMNVRVQRFVEDIATAITATLVLSEATPDRVRLAWQLGSESPAALRVERRSDAEAWATLAEVQPDGTGRVSYEDRAVEPGGRYAYRLAWGQDVSQASAEAWVDVPAAHRFALEGVRPNPATAAGRVHFSLDQPGEVTLELLDLAGRRVGSRDQEFEAGRHSIGLGDIARPSPGIYWLRLSHKGRTLTSRAVIVD